MTIRLGIVMDPIQSINYKKDSSLAMLLAAQKRDWKLYYMEQKDLFQEDGVAMGNMAPLEVRANPEDWFSLSDRETEKLSSLNVILMRKDPPFDNEFIYSTYLLEQAEREGTLIVNKPSSLRDFNEKYFATLFPQCCTSSMVSRDMGLLREFAEKHEDVIFKPLDGMGGTAIFRVKKGDPNVSVILETLTNYGNQQIMAQKFIPEITKGDKRILIIDGEPVPFALARIPQKGETRGNLAAGGTGVAQPLSDRDRWIAEHIGPTLKEKGLLFVGIDVIGDYLTEINVTSPTCICELEDQCDVVIADHLMKVIEDKLAA
ncbi:glutathione synthase [Sansalvadorimonas sp. 2012CJ34-2]|uniref:Glutathione synthetase n=1 Tax=Parendozoicomonas callyspongiae TaxID=2942213 RepID=A0ABT0PBP8_9GAMM|nr:glutathione synthase [Sansalvadorimonas sp. 2012CJ34-2]MCL6268451.1 glutathione synthase [Sansalvadorimonas sp. 2012CJ34-2]